MTVEPANLTLVSDTLSTARAAIEAGHLVDVSGLDLAVVHRALREGLPVVVDAPAEQEPVGVVLGPVLFTELRRREPRPRHRRDGAERAGGADRGAPSRMAGP